MLKLPATLASQLTRQYWDKVRRRILRMPASIPLMRCREVDVIVEVIKRLSPARTLEWGAGRSTLYFPRFILETATWTAIEHDQRWADLVASRNTRRNVKIIVVPPDNPGDDQDPESPQHFKQYVEYPRELGHFNLILIDGRARRAALGMASEILAPSGVIILHDANRAEYQHGLSAFRYSLMLSDRRLNEGGLWLGSKETPIEKVLDVNTQLVLWARYQTLQRWLSDRI